MTPHPVLNWEHLKKLNREPVYVAALLGGKELMESAMAAHRQKADLIELRIDTFSARERKSLEEILQEVRKNSGLPLLATVRSPQEQDPRHKSVRLSSAERLALFKRALPWVEWIDLELSSEPLLKTLIGLAHRAGKKVILSHHNFKAMPGIDDVRDLIKRFKAHKGDVLKIAGYPKQKVQADEFLELCLMLKGMHRIFIAMGPHGMQSRVTAFGYGSCMAYGFVSRSSAPGQFTLKELRKHCGFYYSAYPGAIQSNTKP